MHFITGGAFNGKRAWVKKEYHVEKAEGWLSAYDNHLLPKDFKDVSQDIYVLEGIEIWIKGLAGKYDVIESREFWNQCLNNWLTWEKSGQNHKLVVIGTDITKGIVPLEKENRLWRDLTGWVYQDTAARADQVDVIWYGIKRTIKHRGV